MQGGKEGGGLTVYILRDGKALYELQFQHKAFTISAAQVLLSILPAIKQEDKQIIWTQ